MCLNFGVSEADISEQKYGYGYQKAYKSLRCKQTGTLYSNPSILNAFHSCLRSSYPFASCPNADCENHLINIFEEPPGTYKKGANYYFINKNDSKNQYYQARCSKCKTSFMLSNPLKIHTSGQRNWRSELELFLKLMVNHNGPTNIINILDMHPEKYYARTRLIANQMQYYNNYHIAEFIKYRYQSNEETVCLYTDCIVTSLKALRKKTRSQNMKVVVTTMKKNDRSLILAAHPMFEETNIDLNVLEDDSEQRLTQQHYAYLKHPYLSSRDDRPFLGLDGYFMNDQYAYMGHFLAIRKLLHLLKKIRFYVDGEKALYTSALLAFSDKVKAKQCDIVVVKSDKNRTDSQKERAESTYNRAKAKIQASHRKKYSLKKGTNDIKALRRFDLEREMNKVNRAIKKTKTKQTSFLNDPLVNIHSKAIHRAKKIGEPYWVKDPLADKSVSGMRLLWLTRDKDRMNTDEELLLYT